MALSVFPQSDCIWQGAKRSRAWAGVAALCVLLAVSAGAEPNVAFQETGAGFRVGQKIRVLDLADGSVTQFTDDWLREGFASWGPDGDRIAASGIRGNNEDIFVARKGMDRHWLTNHRASDGMPAWSPDGSRIAFASTRDEEVQLYMIDADGSNLKRLTSDPWMHSAPSWSPDGSRLIYEYSDGWNFRALRVLDLATGSTRGLTRHDAKRSEPTWSLDGAHIAYSVYDEDLRRFHVEAMTADGRNSWRLTDGVGADAASPTWASDGRISFAISDGESNDIAVTDLRGEGLEMLTDTPTWKAGLDWYKPRYFAVDPTAPVSMRTWGWLKHPRRRLINATESPHIGRGGL